MACRWGLLLKQQLYYSDSALLIWMHWILTPLSLLYASALQYSLKWQYRQAFVTHHCLPAERLVLPCHCLEATGLCKGQQVVTERPVGKLWHPPDSMPRTTECPFYGQVCLCRLPPALIPDHNLAENTWQVVASDKESFLHQLHRGRIQPVKGVSQPPDPTHWQCPCH